MTFTAVTPTNFQTDRADLNTCLGLLIADFMTVVPNAVRKHWSELPASLTGEGPFVYVGDITETIVHDLQTRGTMFTGDIGYVDVLADPQQTNDRVAVFADYIREWFTVNARIMPRGILAQTGFREGEISQGTLRFTDARVSYFFQVMEGRA